MKTINLAENLKLYRLRKKITQSQLAKKLNIKQSTISSWETGINIPDIYTLIEITQILDISLNELIGYEINNATYKSDNNKIVQSYNEDRTKILKNRLDLLTDSELDDLELALDVLESRRIRKK